MKEQDIKLSLQEVEELCRLYMECRLSLLEEKELQYILNKLPDSSPVITEARESMIAEGLLSANKTIRKKNTFKWLRISVSIAAVLTVIFTISIFKPGGEYPTGYTDSSKEIVIAYEAGKQLSPEEAEIAVNESMKKAEDLMAMAHAKEIEQEFKQEYLMNLTSDQK